MDGAMAMIRLHSCLWMLTSCPQQALRTYCHYLGQYPAVWHACSIAQHLGRRCYWETPGEDSVQPVYIYTTCWYELVTTSTNTRTHIYFLLHFNPSQDMCPLGGADIRFCSSQPDTYCDTMDMWLVHHVVCMFTSQLKLVLILPTSLGWKAELT